MSDSNKELVSSERQMQIMRIVWDRGSATVREALDEIDDDLAYTSILTVFQTLEDRGHLRHEKEGRAYRFYPVTSREDVAEGWAEHLMDRDPSVARMAAERILEADRY